MKKPIGKTAKFWWINVWEIKRWRTTTTMLFSWKELFEEPDGYYVSTTKPKDTKGWIKVKRVAK